MLISLRSALPLMILLCACGGGSLPTPRFARTGNADRAAPLGPGYVLLPLGTDDDALLGRVLPAAPQPGRALEETAAPSPCADRLGAPKTVGMESTLEDAEELKATADGRAALGAYGFSAQAKRATHFVYRLATKKKLSREVGAEYVACCRDKGCGWGVVTELIYGDADYSAAEETSGEAAADILTIASARGSASLRVLRKREVHGWLAAKVLVTAVPAVANGAPKPPSVLGASQVLLDVDSESAQVKQMYDREKIGICAVDGGWAFCDGADKLDEVQFARKYRETLGTTELADVERPRNGAKVIGAAVGIPTVVMLSTFGGLGWALVDSLDKHESMTATPGFWLGLGGAVAAGAGGLIWLGTDPAFKYEAGSLTNHMLTRDDADRLVERYNRTLLRKITSDVGASAAVLPSADAAPAVRVEPMLKLGALGIQGTF